MEYKIIEGKVQTRALECHVVDHCNLRCDHCCSFSPLLKKWFVDPVIFEKDLFAVSKVVAPSFLKIVGGEPLLHPNLEVLLQIVKDTGVSKKTSVTTNGHLIKRLTAKAWDLIDMLTISIYPEPELSKDLIRYIAVEAKQRKISVSWKVQDKFTCLDRDVKPEYETAKAIYNKCWIHHRCNTIKNGRFYSCTRPQYIEKFAPDPTLFQEDGIEVHTNDSELAHRIKKHLDQSEPLNSCYLCHGGHAQLENHRQLKSVRIQEKKAELQAICEKI